MQETLAEMPRTDNCWLRDAIELFGIAEARRGSDRNQLLQCALFTALGIERLLKALLYRVNPLYVYQKQDFAHTLPVHYPAHVQPSGQRHKILAENPDENVVSMRTAAHRARVVSKAVSDHFSTIHNLIDVRDRICHCDLLTITDERLSVIVGRDAWQLVFALAAELGITASVLLHDSEAAAEDALQEANAPKNLNARIARHQALFESLSSIPEHIAAAHKRAQLDLTKARAVGEAVWEFPCPACSNSAVVSGDVEYDWDGVEHYPIGVAVDGLRCYFCDLFVDDYHEIDLLRIHDR
jgi:hypothetical protein